MPFYRLEFIAVYAGVWLCHSIGCDDVMFIVVLVLL